MSAPCDTRLAAAGDTATAEMGFVYHSSAVIETVTPAISSKARPDAFSNTSATDNWFPDTPDSSPTEDRDDKIGVEALSEDKLSLVADTHPAKFVNGYSRPISSTGFWENATEVNKYRECDEATIDEDILQDDWSFIEPWTSLAERIRTINAHGINRPC